MSLDFEDGDVPRAKQTPSLQPQHTSADGSFSGKAKHFFPIPQFCFASIAHISCIAIHIHMFFLIFSDLVSIRSFSLALSLPFCPSLCLLLQLSGIVTGGSSEDAHISRCLPLQKCISEELAFKATMQDRAESNIVGRFVTSPPEHQLALI